MIGTIARTIILVITVLNAFLTMNGKNPLNISDDAIYQLVSNVAAMASIVWGWWKNNSFTYAAKEGDKTKDRIKAEKRGN